MEKYLLKAKGVECGTYDAIKNLEKLEVLKVLKEIKYKENEYWDDREGLEYWDESFEIEVDIPWRNPIDNSGRCLVNEMIRGLGVEVEWRGLIKKEES